MADYETLHVCRLHTRDGVIHYKLYLLKLTMAVDNTVFMIVKGAYQCSYKSLVCVFLYNTIKWPYRFKKLMKWRHLLNVIITKLVIQISQIDVASAVFPRK